MFSHVWIENMAAFSCLRWDHHGKVNVIVGENDTGKTHLLKMLYCVARSIEDYTKREQTDRPLWRDMLAEKLLWTFQPGTWRLGELVRKGESRLKVEARLNDENYGFSFGKDTTSKIIECTDLAQPQPELRALFLPPKEVLTGLDAVAATREQLQIPGFDDTYQDLIRALRLPTTQGSIQRNLGDVLDELEALFTGEIRREEERFVFRRGREKYWMSQTAEGIKKIGILTTLIRNRTLRQGSVLFVDEPEANLHPNAIVKLMGMLFNLGRAGVQVYLATHSYFAIKELELLARRERESVPFCSLSQGDRGITAVFSDLRDGMPDNPIVDASVRLYEKDVRLDLEA